MKKLAGAVVALVVVLTLTSPGGAITYGTPDDGEHPYVGFMISFVPSEPGWFSCSGTLIDEDTFLSAGHCVFDIGTEGVDTGPSGGSDVWVTFAPEDVLAGWPAREDYETEEALYAARSAWLDANPAFVNGTAYPDPAYDDFASFPENHDLGVVELDQPVPMATYGVLAPLGAAEELAGDTGKGRNDALVETVGYGVQSVHPHPMEVDTRYKSTSRVVEVNGNQSRGGNLHTLNNPSAVGGRGGSCFGDSGGPVFINDTNEILAVVSYGPSATCHGADYSWRVDTEGSYAFILPFLD
jgi:hypothetical protein